MKLLFVHSAEKVKIDEDGCLYTDGSYDRNVWMRYLKVFSHITIVMSRDEICYKKDDAQKKFNDIISEKMDYISIPNKFSSLKSFFSLKKQKEKERIIENEVKKTNAVIVRLPGDASVIKYAKKYGIPYMLEVVGCPFDSLWNHSLYGKILAIPSYFKLKSEVRNAPFVKYVTNYFLQKRYPSRGLSVGCSDVQISMNGPEILETRLKNIEKKKGAFIIGTAAGVGVKYKGQQYVIEALAKLKKEGNENFIYEIAGNGNPDNLKKLVEKRGLNNNVRFIGSIPHENIMDWLVHLDVYVQPSKQEGLPRALIEAMSCATPCIGSDAGGIPELLSKEDVFKKGNVEELVRLLKDVENPKRRVKMSQECFIVSQRYDSFSLEERMIEFMKKCFKASI